MKKGVQKVVVGVPVVGAMAIFGQFCGAMVLSVALNLGVYHPQMVDQWVETRMTAVLIGGVVGGAIGLILAIKNRDEILADLLDLVKKIASLFRP